MIVHLPLFFEILKMDIRHYFNAVNFSNYSSSEYMSWKYTLGASIEKHTNRLTLQNFSKIDIAIIGIPFDSNNLGTNFTKSPEKIRNELYQLAQIKSKTNIVDLGDLIQTNSQKGTYLAIRDIIDYLVEFEITVVIIGGSQDLCFGVCEAFKNEPYFSLSTVDFKADVKKGNDSFNSSNYLSRIFSSIPNLFQFSLLGYQSHYVPPEYLFKSKAVNNHLRLGLIRRDISLVEPVLRNTDVLSFDIGAIKYSEAQGNANSSPNGLRGEEACQIAKYAGLSEKMKVFGIFETELENINSVLLINLSAQVIWYFIEGFSYKQNENPEIMNNMILYKVELQGLEKPLLFLNSKITNRWWMEIGTDGKKVVYIACSLHEYEIASNNEIPELWLKYVQKIDETLK